MHLTKITGSSVVGYRAECSCGWKHREITHREALAWERAERHDHKNNGVRTPLQADPLAYNYERDFRAHLDSKNV